ncbi:MAG: hypothetical protein ACKEQK_00680, partial [Candidatus Hodgkinia cicadicola]
MWLDLKCDGKRFCRPLFTSPKTNLNIAHYNIDQNEPMVNINEILLIAIELGPKVIFVESSLYPRAINWQQLREIADTVGSYLIADISSIASLTSTGNLPSPFPHCHIVTTSTHESLRGPFGSLTMTNHPQLLAKLSLNSIFQNPYNATTLAISFQEALTQNFRDWATSVINNARALSTRLTQRGLPIVTGGTDNHLVLIDLKPLNLTYESVKLALTDSYIEIDNE